MNTKRIEKNFSKSAGTYHQAAYVQDRAAIELAHCLHHAIDGLVSGQCLEIGCGTGLLTQHMLKMLPERQWHITDIAHAMLGQCKTNLHSWNLLRETVSFSQLNGECLSGTSTYALIASGMVLQWFADIEDTVRRMQNRLASGGILLFSFPEASSFTEWKSICKDIDVPYTGHRLPEIEAVKQYFCPSEWNLQIVQNTITTRHPKAIEFFNHLKSIGAHASAQPMLKLYEMKQLLNNWDAKCPEGIISSYNLVYVIAQKLCRD